MTTLIDTATELEEVIKNLTSFNYIKDTEEITVTVLKPHEIKTFVIDLLDRYGGRPISNMYDRYFHGELNENEIANHIKLKHSQSWSHLVNVWLCNYNPLWNVDGTEKHTITTEYGKTTTMTKGTKISNTQIGDDVTTNTRISDTENISSRYNFDSKTFTDDEKSVAKGGDNKSTFSAGTRETSASGDDVDKLTGQDKVTDELIKSGNIGVTMTQQLITAEFNLWTSFNFYEMYMHDIISEITYPMWGD